jgi:hypothetical protein
MSLAESSAERGEGNYDASEEEMFFHRWLGSLGIGKNLLGPSRCHRYVCPTELFRVKLIRSHETTG